MVTYGLPRRQRKKLQTRERIVKAALAAFTKKGIDGCTIDEIALAADVGKGTVYNYFRTKEDLVVAFLMDIERQAQREVSRLARGRGSLESSLIRFIQLQFKLKAPHYPFVRVFLAQLAGKATIHSQWLVETQEVLDPPLNRLFAALHARRLVRTDVDMATLVRAFKIMQLGLMVLWAVEGPPWSHIDDAAREQVRLFCSGIEVRR